MTPRGAIVFAAIVVASAFFGYTCKSAKTFEEIRAQNEIVIQWDKVRDAPDRRLTVSWMGIPRFAVAREGTWIERRLEERFNVEIEPIFLDTMAYDRRKPLAFGAGAVPDVWWEGDPISVQRNVYHGFALEIPYEVIVKHAPNCARQLIRHAPEAWLNSRWEGANYGLPTYGIRNVHPIPGVWRMDWLRNVGIERVPETLEEMETALRKFVYEDPDRDGKDDTIGLQTSMLAWWSAFGEVFGAYGVMPFDWMVRDGQVVWGGLLPESKRALALLAGWYEDGLIDPEFVSTRFLNRQFDESFIHGKSGYRPFGGLYARIDLTQKNSLLSLTKQMNPEAEFAVDKFLKGPDGKRRGRVWGPGAHVICFGRHLAREPEKVIRILKMFDAMARDEQLFLEARMGQRGVHWEFDEDEGVDLLAPYDARNAGVKELINTQLDLGAGFFSAFGATPNLVEAYLGEKEKAFRREYQRPEWAMYDILGKPDTVPSAGTYLGDLRELQKTAYTEIIRGERPVDSFEVFVANWKREGGDIVLKEANELYRAKLAIVERIERELSAAGAAQTEAKAGPHDE